MSTITNKLTVSPSPHIKDKVTTSSLMLNVIIALVPAAVASVVIFGISSLILIATCVITCVVGEYLFNVVCKKPQTIGEMLAEARQKSGAQKLAGHDIMALERFDPDTRHMIVFDVLSHESPMGWKGKKMRLFLTEAGYGKALENQEKGFIKIRNHAKVRGGDLLYDRRDREL